MPASAEEREAKLGGAVLALSGGCSAGAVPGPACPRCESEDTKFCYYNNYNVKQPRYFCKVRVLAVGHASHASAPPLSARALGASCALGRLAGGGWRVAGERGRLSWRERQKYLGQP